MPSTGRTLKAREFLFLVEDRTMAALPQGFPRPERKVEWTILQLHYGDPRAHFELQPQPSRGMVELGLHFEGTVEANDAWAAMLADRAHELRAMLGEGWELEEWTASWRRLHRPFRAEILDGDLAEAVSAEFVKALTVLGPILRDGAPILPVTAR